MNKLSERQEKALKEEIHSLNEVIDRWEETDVGYLSDQLRDLRHRIMYVHLRLEASMELLIGIGLRLEWRRKPRTLQTTLFMNKMSYLYEKMEFYNKLEVCEKMGLIVGKLKGQISKVNDHRKYFSHPASYIYEIRKYRDVTRYRDTLNELIVAFNGMTKIFEHLTSDGSIEEIGKLKY
ncbi:hypothetical protein HY029_05885 [Candidatus Gottesmanbacteria bacterium]|nr:hypothetical protein [Candidatus Gottesmanbacteria bacterium]